MKKEIQVNLPQSNCNHSEISKKIATTWRTKSQEIRKREKRQKLRGEVHFELSSEFVSCLQRDFSDREKFVMDSVF